MSEAAIQHFVSQSFTLDCGVTLPEVSIAYQTYGERFDGNGEGRKRDVVLVSTCFGEVVSWPPNSG
jgi:homoserine acetyltransferase